MKLVVFFSTLANGEVGMVFGLLGLLALGGCRPASDHRVQGYVEGEYVYVASPFAGAVRTLAAVRGAWIQPGDLLFSLDPQPEQSAREEADRRLLQADAQLENARKGQRASEVASMEQQLRQARAVLALSEKNFTRQQELFRTGASAAEAFDAARAQRDEDQHRVAQMEADRQTVDLGSREDQIAAQEANVRALAAALGQAEWNLGQKRQVAPEAGLVFDTLYQLGEWVPAGRPVVALLPPENMKVRAFVPETQVGTVHAGEAVRVRVDGIEAPYRGKVAYVSPQAEYTPPVIYSQESRGKLVFMVEVRFEPAVARQLHPGQPVDVLLP
jgi:HlyD family secretion protein